MKSHERAKKVIDSYLEAENLQENQLYVSIQLDKKGDKGFSIGYYIKGLEEPNMEFIAPEFRFEDEKEAWKEYLTHLPEIYQGCPEATKSVADPGLYEPIDSGKSRGVGESPRGSGGAVIYDPQNKNERFVDCEETLDTREWV
jgi:hypothetical protein